MGICLKQGQGVELLNGEYDLRQVTVSLGWDAQSHKPAEIPSLPIGSSRHHEEFDLDAIAVLLGENNKILDLGSHDGTGRAKGDVVFHRCMRHSSGAIWLTADNRTGAGDGDNEEIIVCLDDVPAIYHRIIFFVAIHDGKHRGQNFSRVANAFIRAVDAQGVEICRFDISASEEFANSCAMSFAEVVRYGDHWMLRAIGKPQASDRFADILRPYL